MRMKLLEMGSKQASARNLGNEASTEKKPKKMVRFKRGDRVFTVTEEKDSIDSDEEDLAES